MAANIIKEHRPKYIHCSPPCYAHSVCQNGNQRTIEQVENLAQKRIHASKIIKNCRKLIELQLSLGGQCGGCDEGYCSHDAGGEHPLRALSWKGTDMGKAATLCGGKFRTDGCMNNLRNPKTGNLCQKSWGWFSSSPSVRKALENKQPSSRNSRYYFRKPDLQNCFISEGLMCQARACDSESSGASA